jgi:hypothetical protein
MKLRLSPALYALTLAALVAGSTYVCWVVRTGDGKDFRDIWMLARYAIDRGVPYHDDAARTAYRDYLGWSIPADEPFLGFVYPPAAIAVVAPLAPVPWAITQAVWFGLLTAVALVVSHRLAHAAVADPGRARVLAAVAVGVLFFHPAGQSGFLLGQPTLLLVGGVVFGLAAVQARRLSLSAAGWAVFAMKPQIGLPLALIPVARSGWRGAVAAAVGAAALTLVGAVLTGDPVAAIRDYAPFVSRTFPRFGVNQVMSDQVLGWNRLVYAVTGREVVMTAPVMLAGYAVGSLAFWLRTRRADGPGLMAYWLAAAPVIGLVFGQGKGYDMVLLVLWLPHLVLGWRDGRRAEAVLFVVALIVTAVPRAVAVRLVPPDQFFTEAVLSYRAWAVLALALYLLVRGPVHTPPTPTQA